MTSERTTPTSNRTPFSASFGSTPRTAPASNIGSSRRQDASNDSTSSAAFGGSARDISVNNSSRKRQVAPLAESRKNQRLSSGHVVLLRDDKTFGSQTAASGLGDLNTRSSVDQYKTDEISGLEKLRRPWGEDKLDPSFTVELKRNDHGKKSQDEDMSRHPEIDEINRMHLNGVSDLGSKLRPIDSHSGKQSSADKASPLFVAGIPQVAFGDNPHCVSQSSSQSPSVSTNSVTANPSGLNVSFAPMTSFASACPAGLSFGPSSNSSSNQQEDVMASLITSMPSMLFSVMSNQGPDAIKLVANAIYPVLQLVIENHPIVFQRVLSLLGQHRQAHQISIQQQQLMNSFGLMQQMIFGNSNLQNPPQPTPQQKLQQFELQQTLERQKLEEKQRIEHEKLLEEQKNALEMFIKSNQHVIPSPQLQRVLEQVQHGHSVHQQHSSGNQPHGPLTQQQQVDSTQQQQINQIKQKQGNLALHQQVNLGKQQQGTLAQPLQGNLSQHQQINLAQLQQGNLAQHHQINLVQHQQVNPVHQQQVSSMQQQQRQATPQHQHGSPAQQQEIPQGLQQLFLLFNQMQQLAPNLRQ